MMRSSVLGPLRRAAFWIVLGVILLASLAARVGISSHRELEQGDEARELGALERAMIHYRRAARFYLPGNPFCTAALERLAAMASELERQGEAQAALNAHRAIRASIMATRSFYTPHAERLARANRRIADLMSALPPPPVDAGKSRERLRREHLALLEAPAGPHIGWTCVALLGFATWVGGAFVFSRRALDGAGRLVPHDALRWGAVIAGGFVLFAAGLSLA